LGRLHGLKNHALFQKMLNQAIEKKPAGYSSELIPDARVEICASRGSSFGLIWLLKKNLRVARQD
jgi:hypothetical protein